jgi:hypothetical protein
MCWVNISQLILLYLGLIGEDRESCGLLSCLFQETIAGQLAKTKQSLESSFYGEEARQAKGRAKLGIFAL